MALIERIDFDVRSLELYFARLFSLLSAPPETRHPVLDDADPHDYTTFIRPDMASNVYSMLDFWLSNLCEVAAKRHKLPLTYKDIKGNNDLDARHKYLTKLAHLDLTSVASSYQHLDILRETRNCLLHAGGHVSPRLETKVQTIPDISVFDGLVTIGDAFIWASLRHARAYLAASAEALEAPQATS